MQLRRPLFETTEVIQVYLVAYMVAYDVCPWTSLDRPARLPWQRSWMSGIQYALCRQGWLENIIVLRLTLFFVDNQC